jgi:hypothetical protein
LRNAVTCRWPEDRLVEDGGCRVFFHREFKFSVMIAIILVIAKFFKQLFHLQAGGAAPRKMVF